MKSPRVSSLTRLTGLALLGVLSVMVGLAQSTARVALAGEWERTPVWATATALSEQNATGIVLAAPGAPSQAWTAVQWQTGQGQWLTVTGWQGTLDADGRKTWRVAPAAFGAGPFRWVVYAQPGGAVWATSPVFNLPAAAGLTVLVTAQPASSEKAGWTVTSGAAAPAGVQFSLQAAAAPAGAWTGVQWQDGRGQWQDVTGWQGLLEAGRKTWWAAAEGLGAGPFRWVIYTQRGGALWAASPAFTLPATDRWQVTVTLLGAP